MVVPCMEIVVTEVGDRTIDDPSNEAGRTCLEAFRRGAETLPGCVRAGFARSYRDSNICMHFFGKPILH